MGWRKKLSLRGKDVSSLYQLTAPELVCHKELHMAAKAGKYLVTGGT